MIKNDHEQIAITYYLPMPKWAGKYFFTCKYGVCMAWVNAEDAPAILAIKGGCCGGRRPGVFRYASENQVKLWETGTYQ